MLNFLSKLFGGSKSEKDVQKLMPIVEKTNQFFAEYARLTNDQLRNKTAEFKQRIQDHLAGIDAEIEARKQEAEALSDTDIHGRDAIYQEVDKLKKDRDKKIEEALADPARSFCCGERNRPPFQRKYRTSCHRYRARSRVKRKERLYHHQRR
jgi:preprotein translocase subunit SecA